MHKTTGAGATAGNEFTDGDPTGGVPPTTVDSDWLNTMQRELVAAVEDSGQTLNPADDSQLSKAIQYFAGVNVQPALKNLIINGGFDLWQRGSSFSFPNASSGYCADRWQALGLGGWTGTLAVSRQNFTLGQTDVPGEPRHYLRLDNNGGMSGGTTPSFGIRQKIEGVRKLAGRQAVISMYLKAGAAVTVRVQYEQNFGAGGSSSVTSSPTNWNLTTSWQRFQLAVTVPSIAGKSIGAGNDDWLGIVLGCLVTTGAIIDIAHVQVEVGTAATEFEQIPDALVRQLCYRYYGKSYAEATAPGTATNNGAVTGSEAASPPLHSLNSRFRSEMRATPTVTWYSPSTGTAAKVYYDGADRTISATLYTSAATTGIPDTAYNPGAPRSALVHWTADAEL